MFALQTHTQTYSVPLHGGPGVSTPNLLLVRGSSTFLWTHCIDEGFVGNKRLSLFSSRYGVRMKFYHLWERRAFATGRDHALTASLDSLKEALYSHFSTSLGRLGTFGFLLFFLALATGVGFPLWSDLLLGPYMAANSPSLYDALPTNNGFIATFLIFALALLVGYLVFSVAVVRARVLPRWGFWLIVLQIIGLASIFGTAIAYAAFLVFEGLFGLSIAGWGYAVLSTRSRVESSERLQVGR